MQKGGRSMPIPPKLRPCQTTLEGGISVLSSPMTPSPGARMLLAAPSLLRDAVALAKEDDEGSVEYKWKLVGLTEDRIQHLMTQMKFRITEGQGECLYELGVDNNGVPIGLIDKEYHETLGVIKRMATQLSCDFNILCEKVVQTEPEVKRCAEVLIRMFGKGDFVDMRVAICGHTGAGKSTLVGVLTRGVLDDGFGLSRQSTFNHLHEVTSGSTSSISERILGFDSRGNVANFQKRRLMGQIRTRQASQSSSSVAGQPEPFKLTRTASVELLSEDQIAETSAKVLTMYDLAGQQHFLKTTLAGLTRYALEFVGIVLRADKGIQRMTKEHLGICCGLKIPFFMVMTYADLLTPSSADILHKQLTRLLNLPEVSKELVVVQTDEQAVACVKRMREEPSTCVPLFSVSNVTGIGIMGLLNFLNLLPVRHDWATLAAMPTEVIVDNSFDNIGTIGVVIAGVVAQGGVQHGDTMLLGPDQLGNYHRVQIIGIQLKRVSVKVVKAGVHASFAIRLVESAATTESSTTVGLEGLTAKSSASSFVGVAEVPSGSESETKEKPLAPEAEGLRLRKGMVLLDPCGHSEGGGGERAPAYWTFHAEITVLYAARAIRNNFEPVIYLHSIRQKARMMLLDEEETELSTGMIATVELRFFFNPEYIKVGALFVFADGSTKGVGTIAAVPNPDPACSSWQGIAPTSARNARERSRPVSVPRSRSRKRRRGVTLTPSPPTSSPNVALSSPLVHDFATGE